MQYHQHRAIARTDFPTSPGRAPRSTGGGPIPGNSSGIPGIRGAPAARRGMVQDGSRRAVFVARFPVSKASMSDTPPRFDIKTYVIWHPGAPSPQCRHGLRRMGFPCWFLLHVGSHSERIMCGSCQHYLPACKSMVSHFLAPRGPLTRDPFGNGRSLRGALSTLQFFWDALFPFRDPRLTLLARGTGTMPHEACSRELSRVGEARGRALTARRPRDLLRTEGRRAGDENMCGS
jgi:hypothetical protein